MRLDERIFIIKSKIKKVLSENIGANAGAIPKWFTKFYNSKGYSSALNGETRYEGSLQDWFLQSVLGVNPNSGHYGDNSPYVQSEKQAKEDLSNALTARGNDGNNGKHKYRFVTINSDKINPQYPDSNYPNKKVLTITKDGDKYVPQFNDSGKGGIPEKAAKALYEFADENGVVRVKDINAALKDTDDKNGTRIPPSEIIKPYFGDVAKDSEAKNIRDLKTALDNARHNKVPSQNTDDMYITSKERRGMQPKANGKKGEEQTRRTLDRNDTSIVDFPLLRAGLNIPASDILKNNNSAAIDRIKQALFSDKDKSVNNKVIRGSKSVEGELKKSLDLKNESDSQVWENCVNNGMPLVTISVSAMQLYDTVIKSQNDYRIPSADCFNIGKVMYRICEILSNVLDGEDKSQLPGGSVLPDGTENSWGRYVYIFTKVEADPNQAEYYNSGQHLFRLSDVIPVLNSDGTSNSDEGFQDVSSEFKTRDDYTTNYGVDIAPYSEFVNAMADNITFETKYTKGTYKTVKQVPTKNPEHDRLQSTTHETGIFDTESVIRHAASISDGPRNNIGNAEVGSLKNGLELKSLFPQLDSNGGAILLGIDENGYIILEDIPKTFTNLVPDFGKEITLFQTTGIPIDASGMIYPFAIDGGIVEKLAKEISGTDNKHNVFYKKLRESMYSVVFYIKPKDMFMHMTREHVRTGENATDSGVTIYSSEKAFSGKKRIFDEKQGKYVISDITVYPRVGNIFTKQDCINLVNNGNQQATANAGQIGNSASTNQLGESLFIEGTHKQATSSGREKTTALPAIELNPETLSMLGGVKVFEFSAHPNVVEVVGKDHPYNQSIYIPATGKESMTHGGQSTALKNSETESGEKKDTFWEKNLSFSNSAFETPLNVFNIYGEVVPILVSFARNCNLQLSFKENSKYFCYYVPYDMSSANNFRMVRITPEEVAALKLFLKWAEYQDAYSKCKTVVEVLSKITEANKGTSESIKMGTENGTEVEIEYDKYSNLLSSTVGHIPEERIASWGVMRFDLSKNKNPKMFNSVIERANELFLATAYNKLKHGKTEFSKHEKEAVENLFGGDFDADDLGSKFDEVATSTEKSNEKSKIDKAYEEWYLTKGAKDKRKIALGELASIYKDTNMEQDRDIETYYNGSEVSHRNEKGEDIKEKNPEGVESNLYIYRDKNGNIVSDKKGDWRPLDDPDHPEDNDVQLTSSRMSQEKGEANFNQLKNIASKLKKSVENIFDSNPEVENMSPGIREYMRRHSVGNQISPDIKKFIDKYSEDSEFPQNAKPADINQARNDIKQFAGGNKDVRNVNSKGKTSSATISVSNTISDSEIDKYF